MTLLIDNAPPERPPLPGEYSGVFLPLATRPHFPDSSTRRPFRLTLCPMKTPSLLVLTDFFKAADRALDYATSLAAPLRARLVLLHVRRDSPLDADALSGVFTNLSAQGIALAMNGLTHDLPVPVVAEVGHGRLLPVVADAVSRHQPVLIVLGRPDREELPDELSSTTALEIMQHVPYPMLVVPATLSSTTAPCRLLLAVDGEEFSLGEYAGMARHLFDSLKAEVTVLHCAAHTHTKADAAAALNSVLQTGLTLNLMPPVLRQVVAASPAEGILATARPTEYDAVVLLARRRSVLGQLFHHSVTAQVLLHSKIPVLVLPAE